MDKPTFTVEKRTDPAGQITIYTAHGQLTGRDACFDWLELARTNIQRGEKHVVINLDDVSKIDSTGLGILASIHVSATNAGGRICLTGLHDKMRTLFETTWLLRVIPHAEDEATAIRTLS